MYRTKYTSRCTEIRINFSLLFFVQGYKLDTTLHTQLQGSTHSVVDSTKPLYTQPQSLFLLLQPNTLKLLLYARTIRIPLSLFAPSLYLQLRASLYLYNPMVRGPWVSRHDITLQHLGQTTL